MSRLKARLRKARHKYREAKHERNLAHPNGPRREKLRRLQDFWEARKHRLKKRLEARKQKPPPETCHPGEPNWNCCRAVTDFVDTLVSASTTSRKRTETYGNPGSEHHVSQTSSDAIDFGIANAYSLAAEVRFRLTGTRTHSDYAFFYFTHQSRRYRGQLIAGTHGTGPHLHFGCTRIA